MQNSESWGRVPRSRWEAKQQINEDADVRSTGKLGSCKYPSQSSQANSEQGKDTAFKII